MITRRQLISVLALAATSVRGRAAEAPQVKPCTSPRVLFICQFGSVKSAIARELFRRRAAERHITVVADSRGLTPREHASANLLKELRRDGIDPGADPLRKLEPADVERADLIVLFDTPPPGLGLEIARDWRDLGSFNDDYERTKADLEARIDGLLDEVAKMRTVWIEIIRR